MINRRSMIRAQALFGLFATTMIYACDDKIIPVNATVQHASVKILADSLFADSASTVIGGGGLQLPGHALHIVSGARFLGKRLAIANSSSQSLRIFDMDGTLWKEVGSAGKGPGEFGLLSSLHSWRGDSLLVWDAGLRRATVISPEGYVARTIPIEWGISKTPYSGWRPFYVHASESGALTAVFSKPSLSDQQGLLRDSLVAVMLDPIGTVKAVSQPIAGSEMFRANGMIILPFGSKFFAGVVGRDTYVAGGRGPQLDEYTAGGIYNRVLDLPIARQVVTPKDRAEARERFILNHDPRLRKRVSPLWDQTPVVDSFPAFELLEEANECLWLRLHSPSPLQSIYLTIDPASLIAQHVVVPAFASFLDARGGYIALLRKGEDEQEIITVHRVGTAVGAKNESNSRCLSE